MHFPDNYGGDTSRIQYIGLKGEATQVSSVLIFLVFFYCFVCFVHKFTFMIIQLKRDVVATIVYELRPNPSDHKYVPHVFPKVLV